MAEGYSVGGDSFRQLIEGKQSGQTFRVTTPFTLRWVDLTMKLLKPDVAPLIRIFYATWDHEPTMEPISWQTAWTLEPPVSRPDWLWNESWGQSLHQNHHWVILADPDPPVIKLDIGILTLTFTHTLHSGIYWTPLPRIIPLRDPEGQPLRICTNNPKVHSLNPADNITNVVRLRNNGDFVSLYFMVKGAWFGFGSGDHGYEHIECQPYGWRYIGTGIHDINLLEYFTNVMTHFGLDPNPEGWHVDVVEIAHSDSLPLLPSYLVNDFIRLHHSHTPAYDPPIPKKDAFIPGNIYRVRFPMKPIILDPDQYYALMVYSLSRYTTHAPSWLYDKDDAQYPRGHRIWRDHPLDPWTHEYNDDHLFILFGDPPAIPPPPEPPIGHWLFPDYRQTQLPTGFEIFTITNVPAHLFLYWTTNEPWVHRVAGFKRGLLAKWFSYFCFVAWNKMEQNEVGDTLEHTFDMLDWPVCQTRWFVIAGEVNDVKSPSISPIFKKHRPAPEWLLIILEPWTVDTEPPTFTRIFLEPWAA